MDNGANYRSQHLALVCAKLGIALIHARPYRPQGKGKIERCFKTVRAQLLTRLTAADSATFPPLDPAISFPYTPVFAAPGDAGAKWVAYLNSDSLLRPLLSMMARKRRNASTWICRTRSLVRPISRPTSSRVLLS